MGAPNIVPGVSGGTMALVLGIYEELINSIKAVLNREAIKHLLRFHIRQGLALIPWQFLLSVAIGIFLAVFTMSHFVEWVLGEYPSLLWGFFFGLVLASIFTVSRSIERWGILPVLGIVLGAAGTYLLVGMVPVETPNTWWFLFLSGALAISAMVMPGLSGAFILVLLGKYEYLLSAVTNGDIVPLLWVIAGAAVGIVTFAQILSWLFKRYHDMTVAVLVGMLVGSLRKIWPWKDANFANILPAEFTWEVGATIFLAILGFVLIWGLTGWAERRKKAQASLEPQGLGSGSE
jgi:putative membrane protein